MSIMLKVNGEKTPTVAIELIRKLMEDIDYTASIEPRKYGDPVSKIKFEDGEVFTIYYDMPDMKEDNNELQK